jgi:hypothetical protein
MDRDWDTYGLGAGAECFEPGLGSMHAWSEAWPQGGGRPAAGLPKLNGQPAQRCEVARLQPGYDYRCTLRRRANGWQRDQQVAEVGAAQVELDCPRGRRFHLTDPPHIATPSLNSISPSPFHRSCNDSACSISNMRLEACEH